MEDNSKIVHSSFWSNLFKTPADKSEEFTLLNLPPFRYLEKKDLILLKTILHHRNYLAGEYIFYKGDPGIGIYIIREGEVEIRHTDDYQNVVSFALFTPGDFFGELALVDGEKRSASAVAKTDVKLSIIFKPDLDEFIDKNPKKGVKILQGLSQIIAIRLRKINEDFIKAVHANNQEQLFKQP